MFPRHATRASVLKAHKGRRRRECARGQKEMAVGADTVAHGRYAVA